MDHDRGSRGDNRRPSGRGRVRTWFADRRNWKKVLIPLAAVAAVLLMRRIVDVEQHLTAIQQWVARMGPWGGAVFILIYIGATLLLLPGTPFTILAAFLFGYAWGYVIMLVASTLAAVIGFLISRHGARNRIEKGLSDSELLGRLKRMVEKNHRITIVFVRIMPFFPFAVNNYALGLTNIPFWSYLLFSELVFVPMNAVLIMGAFAIYRLMILGEINWTLLGITTAAGILVLLLGYAARRAFGSPSKDSDKPGKSDSG